MSDYTGWFLVLTMNLVLATCIGIMVSPLGNCASAGLMPSLNSPI
jgi:choline-glycine betaine transporter